MTRKKRVARLFMRVSFHDAKGPTPKVEFVEDIRATVRHLEELQNAVVAMLGQQHSPGNHVWSADCPACTGKAQERLKEVMKRWQQEEPLPALEPLEKR